MALEVADTANNAPLFAGLSDEEVHIRVQAGLVNVNTDVKTKPAQQIVLEHMFTLFNAVNLLLAILVVITGEWRNMLFMLVVIFNLVIGIFQELRAKHLVDKLTLLVAKPVRVLRNGQEVFVDTHELVLDDIYMLSTGDQVPADATVVAGYALLDESLITGESDSVEKNIGDELFSGSFVQAGALWLKVIRVGADGYAAKLGADAKFVKPANSEILITLKLIIKTATYVLIPVGAALFLRIVFMDGATINSAILSMVAAVVGMIPQGLVLLTSSVLAISVTRLAQKQVLVQQSYCIETLARVDLLCLDKTGTITSGSMKVSSITKEEPYSIQDVINAISEVTLANEDDLNATSKAFLSYANEMGFIPQPIERTIPFSSQTKFSGCVLHNGHAYVVGAAQIIFPDDVEYIESKLAQFSPLERALAVSEVSGFDDEGNILGKPQLMGFVTLTDEIRSSARDTVTYFTEQGVGLKVISGDDPKTVSAIAQSVGIQGAQRYIDASKLTSDSQLVAAAEDMVVFGRVTPQQKRTLIQAFRGFGHTVAMTGDGINDVLALKEADCSISMASGSAAARNISEIVLADNDFSHMPDVVWEGRRSINNLERSSILFLVKTVYSALLALICLILPPYPFIPIQMSLISSSIIGIPSFILALEPNHERVREGYLVHVLARSLPASFAIVLALLASIIWGRFAHYSFGEVSTLCCLLTCIIGIALIIRISYPPTPLRIALIVVVIAIVVLGITAFPNFFSFAPMSTKLLIPLGIIGVISLALFIFLYDIFSRNEAASHALSEFVSTVESNYVRRSEQRFS